MAKLFNDAMTSISTMSEHAVVAAYDFDACPVVVDVGGGHGRLLATILAAAPRAAVFSMTCRTSLPTRRR